MTRYFKKNIPAFIIMVGVFACGNKEAAKPVKNDPVQKEEIKVMSYNVHHCNPPAKEGVIDVNAIAAIINAAKPDVVGLQEIDVNTLRSGKDLDQAKELAAKTNMNFYFAKSIDYQGGAYGIAILSKYAITEAKVYPLGADPATNSEPRVLVTAKIVLPSGKAIRFANTHLDATSNPTNKEMQIKEINAIASKESLPFIITGDFNAIPGSEVIKAMDQVFTRTCFNCLFTIPADKPTKCIDFIGYTTKDKLMVKKHEVISAPEASDHLPVAAVLQLN
jgi:endonuclease/exonuclease/phosphatase family metal-dependent hydrolase